MRRTRCKPEIFSGVVQFELQHKELFCILSNKLHESSAVIDVRMVVDIPSVLIIELAAEDLGHSRRCLFLAFIIQIDFEWKDSNFCCQSGLFFIMCFSLSITRKGRQQVFVKSLIGL